MIGGGGESRRVVVRRTSAVRFMRGRQLSWTSGFETITMKRGEAKGFFQKGGAGAKREIEVNWNIYGRGW